MIGIIIYLVVGIFIVLWLFTMSLETEAARKAAMERYLQLRKDIEAMPEYNQWRMSVFKKCGRRCAFCGSAENLQIHHCVSFYSIVIRNRITSIKEASDCMELWNTNNGKVLCKECHDKMESSWNRRNMMAKNKI